MDSARQVSLVQHIKLDWEGHVSQGSLAVGDVDNDGDIELAVGSVEGDLSVFKHNTCIAKAKDLGSIVSVFIEPLFVHAPLIVVTSQGTCLFFAVSPVPSSAASEQEQAENTQSESRIEGNEASQTREESEESPGKENESQRELQKETYELKMMSSFEIPWNVTCSMLCDISSSYPSTLGSSASTSSSQSTQSRPATYTRVTKELVVASHDGGALSESKVCGFKVGMMVSQPDPGDSQKIKKPEVVEFDVEEIFDWLVPGAAVSLSQTHIGPKELILVGFQFGGFASIMADGTVLHHRLSNNTERNMRAENGSSPSIAGEGEMHQDALHMLMYGTQDEDIVLVEKPTYIVGNVIPQGLEFFDDRHDADSRFEKHTASTVEPSSPNLEVDGDLGSEDMHGFSDSDEESFDGRHMGLKEGSGSYYSSYNSGSFRVRRKPSTSSSQHSHPVTTAGATLVAVCFGGRIRLERLFFVQEIENALFNALAWQEHQTRQLFALQSFDVNGNGEPELITCAWDGLTCVYDLDNNVVRFQFDGRVQGFLAGNYSVEKGKTKPCFVYVTFDGSIFIYTDVAESMRNIPALTMVDILREQCDLKDLFNKLDTLLDTRQKETLAAKMRGLNEGIRGMAFYSKLLHRTLYNFSHKLSHPESRDHENS